MDRNNNLNQASFLTGTGTNTNALAIGGATGSGGNQVANTEIWNGTNWTESGDLNSARRNAGAAGTYTSGLAFGGDGPIWYG